MKTDLQLREVPNIVPGIFEDRYIHFAAFQKDERFSVYWNKCMEAVRDTELLNNIIFCNDALKIPPVKVFLLVHEEFFTKEASLKLLDNKIHDFVKRGIGAFWGAVFKGALGYTSNKSVAASMTDFGIKTASIFIKGEKKMEIRIHRGNQIGGCVTEISTATTKIVIDFGEELEHSGVELDVKEILDGCSAVFFSHYHGDHIGMYDQIPNDVPAYIGDLSKKMLLVLAKHAKKDPTRIEKFETYQAPKKIQIGDISIKPLFVDHSAIDAHMFVVEAGGEKILYTGDFRAHGFRGSKLPEVLEKYVGEVNALITEGTTLSRPENSCESEHDLQTRAKGLIARKKYVFALCSSMNIDRIGAFCKATPNNKYFLCDDYQKEMLDVVTAELAKKTKLYDFGRVLPYKQISEEEKREKGFVMLVRANESNNFRKIIDQYPPDERLVIYSVWDGYAKDPKKYPKYSKFLDGLEYEPLHTSGHADAAAIKNLVSIVKPKKIYPIHTENAAWFKENFPDIEVI